MAVTDDPELAALSKMAPTVGEHAPWRLYQVAIDEYRFQITLNNQRFQWYVGIDSALLAVGMSLARISNFSVAIFAVGIFLAGLTAAATARQVGYQHAARDRAKEIAAELGVTDLSIITTPGWHPGVPPKARFVKVRTMNYGLLAALALAHSSGILLALTR